MVNVRLYLFMIKFAMWLYIERGFAVLCCVVDMIRCIENAIK